MTVLDLKDISMKFNDGTTERTILSNCNFKVEEGESIAIVGRSGSGKTTTLNIMSGLISPSSGEVRINDIPISQKNIVNIRRRLIGYIFQQHNLFQNLNVQENILLPSCFSKTLTNENLYKNMLELLDDVQLPKSILKQKTGVLSGGEKQRVCIVRALIHNPKLLFADEPTGSLDSENEKKIIELFEKIRKEKNTSIILVTHSNFVAESMQSIYTITKQGKIETIPERIR